MALAMCDDSDGRMYITMLGGLILELRVDAHVVTLLENNGPVEIDSVDADAVLQASSFSTHAF
jgi:hypothetical protein